MNLVSEADVILPVEFTDSSRFQHALMVKTVRNAEIMTVSERENMSVLNTVD